VAVWGVETAPARAAPPASPGPALLSPAVVVAALAAGAYASIAAAFARRFEAGTTYKPGSKSLLVTLWPVLALVSPPFRHQLRTALATNAPPPREQAAVRNGRPAAGPPPLPSGPSQTAGGRTTADSSMLRPDRAAQQQAVDWSREM
jgi:hypothetical protein